VRGNNAINNAMYNLVDNGLPHPSFSDEISFMALSPSNKGNTTRSESCHYEGTFNVTSNKNHYQVPEEEIDEDCYDYITPPKYRVRD